MDKAGIRQLVESEAKLQVRTDEDGKYVTFSRPVQKQIKDETVELTPPWVLEVKDGEEVDFEDPTRLGNGSTVTCKVAVYDTQLGKGHTLEAVRVDELVEFKKDDTTVTSTERKF